MCDLFIDLTCGKFVIKDLIKNLTKGPVCHLNKHQDFNCRLKSIESTLVILALGIQFIRNFVGYA
jgi:hypothetical protein